MPKTKLLHNKKKLLQTFVQIAWGCIFIFLFLMMISLINLVWSIYDTEVHTQLYENWIIEAIKAGAEFLFVILMGSVALFVSIFIFQYIVFIPSLLLMNRMGKFKKLSFILSVYGFCVFLNFIFVLFLLPFDEIDMVKMLKFIAFDIRYLYVFGLAVVFLWIGHRKGILN